MVAVYSSLFFLHQNIKKLQKIKNQSSNHQNLNRSISINHLNLNRSIPIKSIIQSFYHTFLLHDFLRCDFSTELLIKTHKCSDEKLHKAGCLRNLCLPPSYGFHICTKHSQRTTLPT